MKRARSSAAGFAARSQVQALAVLLAAPGCMAHRPPLVFHGVDPGAQVKGWVSLTADTHVQGDGTSVQYFLNGRPLTGPIASSPYTYNWFTGSVWDGPDAITTVVYDKTGREIAHTQPVHFQIANGDASLAVDLLASAQPLKGTFHWEAHANRPMPQEEIDWHNKNHTDVKKYEALLFAVDGLPLSVRFGAASNGFDLDTTRFSDGPHELFVAAYATKPGLPATGMWQETVVFANGNTLSDVRSRWRDIFVAPGEVADVAPRAVFTNDTTGPIVGPVTFETADPRVATVDEAGHVTGIASGATTVKTTAMGKTSTARLIVDTHHGLWHFSRDGHVLSEYDAARSVFVRSMFFLSAEEADRLPGLDFQIRQAGVNTLTTRAYFNPADGGNQKDFESWKKAYEPWYDQTFTFAKNHDYEILLTGDDIERTTKEMNDSISSPWAPQAIQFAFTKARDSGRVVSVEMVDEASALWGATPTPTNGAWLKRSPAIPDDAFVKIVAAVNGVANRPKIAWPVLGIAPPDIAHNWMGDPAIADYVSHFWDIVDWRRVYPSGASVWQLINAMNRVVVGRYPVVRRDCPSLLLTHAMGPVYTKRAPGGEFTVGTDEVTQGGLRPVDVSAMNMYAAIIGTAGVRAYAFDSATLKGQRESAPLGGSMQPGSEPFETGTDRWQAISASFNLLGHLEPYLFQQQVSSTDLGQQIVTGARSGPRGTLFMALNGTEASTTIKVDLSAYSEGAARLVRYRVCGATSSTAQMAPTASDTVTFAAGETIAWLFMGAGSPEGGAPSVRFAQPIPDLIASGRVAVVVADSQSRAAKVELYADGKIVGTKTSAPFSFTWDTAGSKGGTWHGLRAVAYGAGGATSEARTMVQVTSPAASKQN